MHPLLHPITRATPTGRYAPSPTGDLHLGNLRTALLAHQQMVELGGTFILRIEDTDTPRNVPGAEDRILADLQSLDITWHEGPDIPGPAAPYRQSHRTPIYLAALNHLADLGLVYPCTCSRKDLQSAPSAPHGPEGPVYPGTCRHTPSTARIRELIHQATSTTRPRDLGFSLRLRISHLPTVTFIDELSGSHTLDPSAHIGDIVILRRDSLWAYQFACAVDDALMGITHVTRGADLLHSTPRQAAIILTLGHTPPLYHHVPLAADPHGLRLSKRDGSLSLQQLKQQGLSFKEIEQAILSLPDVNPSTNTITPPPVDNSV